MRKLDPNKPSDFKYSSTRKNMTLGSASGRMFTIKMKDVITCLRVLVGTAKALMAI